MKSKIKKIVSPMVLALIAFAGAFASNMSKEDNAALVDRIGHLKVDNKCTPTNVVCSTIFNPQMCVSGSTLLFDWNGVTDCVTPLYRRP